MPFDINARGSIDFTPLVSYEAAVIADAGCALRLVLATPSDPLGTGSIVVQLAMSIEQAEGLGEEIRKMLAHIENARRTNATH
jgi:hypothetical protein